MIRLALVLDLRSAMCNVGPRDEESRAWLMAHESHTVEPMATMRRAFLNRPMGEREAKEAAGLLEHELTREWRIYCDWHYGVCPPERVTFEVRACKYEPVIEREELVEL